MVRKGYKEAVSIYLISKVAMTMNLVEALMDNLEPAQRTEEVIERLFLYSIMWAFGGPMVVDKEKNCRAAFSEAF